LANGIPNLYSSVAWCPNTFVATSLKIAICLDQPRWMSISASPWRLTPVNTETSLGNFKVRDSKLAPSTQHASRKSWAIFPSMWTSSSSTRLAPAAPRKLKTSPPASCLAWIGPLATARNIEVTGIDLHGAQQRLHARVCEVGPFLALKLRAFCDRQQPKDAFDILYTLRHYDCGTSAAVTAFANEVCVGNPACPDALRSLRDHFADENAPGPVKASHFVLGQTQPSESEDTRFLRNRIRQDTVDAARLLFKASCLDQR